MGGWALIGNTSYSPYNTKPKGEVFNFDHDSKVFALPFEEADENSRKVLFYDIDNQEPIKLLSVEGCKGIEY